MFDHDTIHSMKKIKNDLIVIGFIVFASMMLLILYRAVQSQNGSVIIYQNGERIRTCLLTEEQTITIGDPMEGYNILVISKDGVYIREADCPDRLCVKHRKISKGGESIICLPHKLVVQIEAEDAEQLDAVTN